MRCRAWFGNAALNVVPILCGQRPLPPIGRCTQTLVSPDGRTILCMSRRWEPMRDVAARSGVQKGPGVVGLQRPGSGVDRYGQVSGRHAGRGSGLHEPKSLP
jgi:hypothetical protein